MSKTVDIKTMDGWELVRLFCWYGDPLPIVPKTLREEIETCVWEIRDGYDGFGSTPVWPSIMNSTPGAKDRMAKMIRRILHRERITTIEVRDLKLVTA